MRHRNVAMLIVLASAIGCAVDRYEVSPTDHLSKGGTKLSIHVSTISETSVVREGYDSFNFGLARSPGATGFVVTIFGNNVSQIRRARVDGTVTYHDQLKQALACQYIRIAEATEGRNSYYTAYLVPESIVKEIRIGNEVYRVMPYGTYKFELIIQTDDDTTEATFAVHYRHTMKYVNPSKWE